jgi:hypothetical protein
MHTHACTRIGAFVTDDGPSPPELVNGAVQDGRIDASEFGWMIFWSIFFGVVSMPLNLLGSYLTGIAISKV